MNLLLPAADGGGSAIWILSALSGKPIYSSCGREEDLCSTFALLHVFIKRFETWKDTLHRSQFYKSVFSPLLGSTMNLFSKAPILRLDIFEKRGDNFDLRRWLDGLGKRVDACVKGFNEDPVVFLMGFRILPLNPTDREFIVTTMAAAINELSPKNVAFGILVVNRQLVALVRMKGSQMLPSDFNDIVVNIIETHSSLRDSETWCPICLPQFDQNFFLHCYIAYLWDGTGPCLLLMSSSKDSFFNLQSIRHRIEENMLAYKGSQLRVALSHPEPFSLKQVGSNELWHFMYKNPASLQVCCSSPQIPYITHGELHSLYRGYFKLANMLRKSKNVRMFFLTLETYSLFSWHTSSFELHCTFSPLVTQTYAMETAEKMLRLFRKEEKRLFINISTAVLNG